MKRQHLGVSRPSTETTYDCDSCGKGRNTLSRAHWHNKGGHPVTIGWIDGVWLSLPYRDKVCRDDSMEDVVIVEFFQQNRIDFAQYVV